MSDQTNDKYLGKFLNARKLLQNKGIRCIAWEEWEKASTSLPKVGQKQYEPNGSWLENNAIQNGINIRKDLLNLEKVDRVSNLATAEWLPHKKKAKVIKKSGQEWTNFGQEVDSVLYLIPEEAMFLLEMNSIELFWNGVALSIQQAYEVLFSDPEFTLDHYRVYRQLVKEGYQIQRYTTKKSSTDSRHPFGKKVIIEPVNGLRLTKSVPSPVDVEVEDLPQSSHENNNPKQSETDNSQSANTSAGLGNLEKETEKKKTDPETPMEVDNSPGPEKKKENNVEEREGEDKKKDKAKKIEIISDEIVIDNIPISSATKWMGSRIQRNVKLIPKRTSKHVPSGSSDPKEITVIETNSRRGEKRPSNVDNQRNKKLRNEVIDISDDEDKNVNRPLTRMELLDRLPNIAANSVTAVKINRSCIPTSIKPKKEVYYYRKSKWMSSEDETANRTDNNRQLVTNVFNSRVSQSQQNQNQNQEFGNQPPGLLNRLGHNASQWISRSTFFQQNYSSHSQRHSIYQSTLNCNVLFGVMQNVMRSIYMSVRYRSPFQTTVQQNVHVSYHQNTQQSYYNCRQNYTSSWRPQMNYSHSNLHQSHEKPLDIVEISGTDEVNVPSFSKHPNVSSWAELKEKWLEEKTITIDDEEASDADGEIQVLKQSVKPLLKVSGPMNFGEIFEKLRIIKPAPDVSTRKKSSDYTLSYNVYSSSQPFRKASPGTPAYRVLILRAQNESCMDLKKLSRLQQEMKEVPIIIAYVSNAITYTQPGFVSMQNWY